MAQDMSMAVVLQLRDELTAGLGTANTSLKTFQGNVATAQEEFAAKFGAIAELSKRVGMDMVIAGGAITGTLTAAALSAAAYGDAIDEMAQRTGASTDYLQGMKYAADQTGGSLDAVEMGLRMVARRASDAAQGSKEAGDSFARYGITITDASGQLKSAETLMDEVGAAMRRTQSDTERTGIAVDMFGRSGTRLVPIFTDAEKTAKAFRLEAKRLGVALDPDAVKKAGKYADTMQSLKDVLAGAWRAIGMAAIPTLEKIAAKVQEQVPYLTRWAKEHETASGAMATAGLVMGGALEILGGYLWMVPSWITTLNLLAESFVGVKVAAWGAAVAVKASGIIALVAAGEWGAAAAAMWVAVLPLVAIAAVVLSISSNLGEVNAMLEQGIPLWKALGITLVENLVPFNSMYKMIKFIAGWFTDTSGWSENIWGAYGLDDNNVRRSFGAPSAPKWGASASSTATVGSPTIIPTTGKQDINLNISGTDIDGSKIAQDPEFRRAAAEALKQALREYRYAPAQ